MGKRFAACLALASCCACGGDTPPPTTPSGPSPDFSVSCQPSGFGAGGGCATSACTVASLNGFAGAVTLACSGTPAGLECGFGPNPLTVTAGGSVRSGFTVAAGPSVPNRVYTFEVAATGGSVRRTASVSVETVFVAPPHPVSSRSFMVSGCTGYVDGVLGAGTLQSFIPNFVVARKKGLGGPGCVQGLGGANGRFDLEIPRGCFAEGESFDLLAGGVPTCVSRPFAGGSNDWAVLLGRRTAQAGGAQEAGQGRGEAGEGVPPLLPQEEARQVDGDDRRGEGGACREGFHERLLEPALGGGVVAGAHRELRLRHREEGDEGAVLDVLDAHSRQHRLGLRDAAEVEEELGQHEAPGERGLRRRGALGDQERPRQQRHRPLEVAQAGVNHRLLLQGEALLGGVAALLEEGRGALEERR